MEKSVPMLDRLRKIEALNYDTLNKRPTVGKADLPMLLLKALIS